VIHAIVLAAGASLRIFHHPPRVIVQPGDERRCIRRVAQSGLIHGVERTQVQAQVIDR